MVVIEVDLKEGDEEPEQHLEDGEHIERIVVPLDQLYEKLQGMLTPIPYSHAHCQQIQRTRKRREKLSMHGKSRGPALSVLNC